MRSFLLKQEAIATSSGLHWKPKANLQPKALAKQLKEAIAVSHSSEASFALLRNPVANHTQGKLSKPLRGPAGGNHVALKQGTLLQSKGQAVPSCEPTYTWGKLLRNGNRCPLRGLRIITKLQSKERCDNYSEELKLELTQATKADASQAMGTALCPTL